MSDLMLYGVLRMPYDLTMANELSRRQFYSRVQEAASRLEAAEAKLEELSHATPSPSTAPKVWIKHLTGAECKPDGRCYDIAFAPMPGYTEYSAAASGTAPTVEVDERAAFEAWAKSDYENLGGEYAGPGNTGWWYWDDITAAAWDAWEARASKPPAREAAERQSIDTGEFREMLQEYWRCMGSGSANKVTAKIIAYIDAWAGAAPAQPLAYIAPHVMESLRARCHVATVLSPVPDEKATEALYG